MTVDVDVASVAGLVPTLDIGVSVDTASLPNVSDILESFKNLSIPQVLSLVRNIVEQFNELPLLKEKLPLLDQSLADLASLITDKVDTLFAKFNALQADLQGVLDKIINTLQTKANTISIGGHTLGEALAAIGPERQDALFHALEHLQGTIQGLPADFDLIGDGAGSKLLAVAGAFRGLKETIADIEANVPGAVKQGVVDFFEKQVAGTDFSVRPILAQIGGLIPSGDRAVELVMEALGLELKDLFTSQAVVDALDAAKAVAEGVIAGLPTLPTGDLGSATLNTARDDAQAALTRAADLLQGTADRLEEAVVERSAFAAMRALTWIEGAVGELRVALNEIMANALDGVSQAFADARDAIVGKINELIDDVRAKMFDAFPLGGITFEMPDGDAVQVNLHFARSMTKPVSVQFDLADAGLPDFIPLDLDGTTDGNIALRADFTAGFGIDLDQGGGHFLAPFVANTSKIELTADVDLNVSATATIGGLTLEIVNGIIKLKDAIDLGDDNAVGGVDGAADEYGQPARLALTLNDPSPDDGRIYFSELNTSSFDADFDAGLLINLPVKVGSNLLADPIFVKASIHDFSDFDFKVGGLPAGLIEEIKNGLTELNLENLVAGFETLYNAISEALQSALVGGLPLVGDDLSAVGAELDKVKTEFIDPFLDFVKGLAAGLTPKAVLEQLQQFVFDKLGPDGLDILQGLVAAAGGDASVIDAGDVPITWLGKAADFEDSLGLTRFEAGYAFDLTVGFDKLFHLPLG